MVARCLHLDVFILIFTPRQGPCQAVSSLFFVQRVGSHHWGSFNSDREKFDKIWIRHGILILHWTSKFGSLLFSFFQNYHKSMINWYVPACCQLNLHILFIRISFPFLDAFLHLYNRVCPSVRSLVRPSIGHTRVETMQACRFWPKLLSVRAKTHHMAVYPALFVTNFDTTDTVTD